MNGTSREQQNIIDKMKESKNVVVDACAGSGKSTTILSTAKQMPEKQILQLTYNATLRSEIKEKIQELKLENIIVHTFHSLAVRFYLPTAYNDAALRRIIHNNLPPKEKIPKFDIIVIDEAQDMTFLYYQFVIKFTKDMGSQFQLLVLGDYMQGLYEFKGSDTRFLTQAEQIWKQHSNIISKDFVMCTLKTSYRITNQIANFVNTAMLGENRLIACKEGAPVVYIRRSTKHAALFIVNAILNLLQEPDVLPSDFFILASSVKGTSSSIRKIENILVENNIPCHVPMMETEKLDDRVIEGKVVFSTFHSVKGRQRKYVFVVGFDRTPMSIREINPDKCPNTLYVATTRATHGLYVIERADDSGHFFRPLEFLKMNHYDMIKSEFTDFKGTPRTLFYCKDAVNAQNNKKTNFITPTELIKFMQESTLEEISPLLEKIFIPKSTNLEPIDIPTVIKTKQGFYEDVSDLNGIAIPAVYYDKINKYKIVDNDIDLDYRPDALNQMVEMCLFDIKTGEHHFLEKITQAMPKCCQTIGDYLYLSNIYSAISEKLYFKLKQINDTEYDWLNEDIVDECQQRMQNIIGQEKILMNEQNIIIQSDDIAHVNIDEYLNDKFVKNMLFRFTARVDMITEDSVWEIKCTSNTTIDHMMQVVIYRWLWQMTTDEEKEFKLFNIKTGELFHLEASDEEIDGIMLALLKGKYEKIDKISDEHFLQNCNTYMETIQ